MELEKIDTVEIRPTPPFNFDATFHKPYHFTSGDNDWQPGIRWQTCNWQGRQLGLKFRNLGTIDEPELALELYADQHLDSTSWRSLADEMIYRFNLQLDLNDFYAKFAQDDLLGPILERWCGMRPGHPSSLYEYLIIGIVLQNATVRRSKQMFQALLETYGQKLDYDGKQLYCFWSPGSLSDVSEEELRALKVGYRAKSIKRIDEYVGAGQIDEFELRLQDLPTQRRQLLALYGVGPATVWYLLFDVFHHWGFFDHVSPWEQKIYSKLFFDRDPQDPVPVAEILRYFDRYGDYKQLAVHYIWEDLWWQRKNAPIPWLEQLIRL